MYTTVKDGKFMLFVYEIADWKLREAAVVRNYEVSNFTNSYNIHKLFLYI